MYCWELSTQHSMRQLLGFRESSATTKALASVAAIPTLVLFSVVLLISRQFGRGLRRLSCVGGRTRSVKNSHRHEISSDKLRLPVQVISSITVRPCYRRSGCCYYVCCYGYCYCYCYCYCYYYYCCYYYDYHYYDDSYRQYHHKTLRLECHCGLFVKRRWPK